MILFKDGPWYIVYHLDAGCFGYWCKTFDETLQSRPIHVFTLSGLTSSTYRLYESTTGLPILEYFQQYYPEHLL